MMTGGLVLTGIGLSFLSTLLIGKFAFLPETPGYVTFGLIWAGFLCLFVGIALVIAYLFSTTRREKIQIGQMKTRGESPKNSLGTFEDWNLQLEFQKWLEGHQGASAGQILNEVKTLLTTSENK